MKGPSNIRKDLKSTLKEFLKNKSREMNGQSIYGLQFIIIGGGSLFYLQNSDKFVTIPFFDIILSPIDFSIMVAMIGVIMIVDDLLGQKVGNTIFKILNVSWRSQKRKNPSK